MTTAIYLDRNDDGDYQDVTVAPYFKPLDGDTTVLVVARKNGDATATPLNRAGLQALRDGIDDVLRGAQ